MSSTPKTEDCLENLDHSFGYIGVFIDIPKCPLNYRLETQEQPVPMDDPSLTWSRDGIGNQDSWKIEFSLVNA